jgi:hypothetical protein
MAVRTLLEIEVFKHIVEKESITSHELANLTKADKILLGEVIHAGSFKDSTNFAQSVCSVFLVLLDMLWK